MRIRDGQGRCAAAATQLPLQRAARRALDGPALAAALGQLGDNALDIASLETSGVDFSAGSHMHCFTAHCSLRLQYSISVWQEPCQDCSHTASRPSGERVLHLLWAHGVLVYSCLQGSFCR